MKTTGKNTGIFIASVLLLSVAACNGSNNQGSAVISTKDTSTSLAGHAQNVTNTSRGEVLFQQKCSACHGLNGSYRNNNAANLQQTKLDSIGIITTIKNGRGAMPMFGTTMPDTDLAQVELYVKSLRKS